METHQVPRRDLGRIIVVVGAAGILVTVAGLARIASRLSAASGLNARYTCSIDGRIETRDQIDAAPIEPSTLRDVHRALTPVRDRWDGYLIVPATESYRFLVNADGPAGLSIDGKVAADRLMTTGGPVATLNRGLHPISLEYEPQASRPRLGIFQAVGAGPFSPVPRLYLVTGVAGFDDTRLRRGIVAAGRIAPFVVLGWPVLALWVFARGRTATAGENRAQARRLAALILCGAAALFLVASWWGLPAYFSWAADEVSPDNVLTAVEAHFANGWATKYPPLHYMVLALVSLPWYLAARVGLVDINDLFVASSLLYVARLVSVAMAMGIVWCTYSTAREHFGDRAARLAALVLIASLPLTYYAKTANLDVPYVFWLALALRWFARTATTATSSDFYLFSIAGAASIATKDQAYGFYVLPALAIAALAWTRPGMPGVPSAKTLAAMAGLTLLAIVLFMNVPFNFRGVLQHVQLLTGPDSLNFRMYERTLGGTARMLIDSVRELANVMSWPLLLAATAASVATIARRRMPGVLLLTAALSYVVTFLWVVLYQYDRFWLGVVVTLAPVTGWWLDRVTRHGVRHRTLRLSLAVFALAYGVTRCAALDLMMLRDSRYAVERRLRAEAGPGDGVTAIGERPNLPRPEFVPWTAIRARAIEFEQQSRALLAVNVAYGLRRGEGFDDTLVRTGLSADERYAWLADYRSSVPFPLSLEPRFAAPREDESSNLTKINPLIRLYRRRSDLPARH